MGAAQTLPSEVAWTDLVLSVQANNGDRKRGCARGMTNPAQESDNEFAARLIDRIAEGDASAFDALYERFSRSLYGMAYRMMNDPKEAEDVLQEGFTYIWRKAATYDRNRSSPFAWAVMIIPLAQYPHWQACSRMKARCNTPGCWEEPRPSMVVMLPLLAAPTG